MEVVAVGEADHPSPFVNESFPVYRGHFYERVWSGSSPAASYCFDVKRAHNVHQVFAWAEASARGRTYCVYAVYTTYDGQYIQLQLSGDDPNRQDDLRRVPPPELAAADELQSAGDDSEGRSTARAMELLVALSEKRRAQRDDESES